MLKIFRGFNPWVVILVATAAFHIWRGSGVEALIFIVGSVVVLSQVLGFTKFGFKYQRQLSPWPIAVILIAVGLILFFSPRASVITGLTMSVIFIGIFPFIFYKDLVHQPAPRDQAKRARWVWSLWALTFSLIELFAFAMSNQNGGTDEYPTISLLLNEPLNEPVFRAVFVISWLIAGVYLFGVRRR